MVLRPVILLCPARSGGSVVASMLGRHPALYGMPELRLFHRAQIADLLDEAPLGVPDWRLSGLLRALAQIHDGEQTRASVDRARSWLEQRRAWSTKAVFEHLRAAVAPLAIVEKSPETVRTPQALERALAAYPEARFVHLVRHPLAAIASMVAAWSRLKFWAVAPAEAHAFCARHWVSQHRLIMRSVASHRVDCLRLRAEDVTDPARSDALARFCDWAALECGQKHLAAMRSPQESPFAGRGPAGAEAGLDPGFLAAPALRPLQQPQVLTPPDRWAIGAGMACDLRRLAAEFGYGEALEASRTGIARRGSLR